MRLAKLFEHNHWATRVLIRACAPLDDALLDAVVRPGQWSIRQNIVHMIEGQQGYVSLLTRETVDRCGADATWAELEAAADASGERLLDLARRGFHTESIVTADGYRVESWVVMLQAIHHAIEHRKQVAGLMRDLERTPPCLDGWGYGEATGTVVRIDDETVS